MLSGLGLETRGRATSCINPDTSAATANPDVNANSSCFHPDHDGDQKRGTAGITDRNFHSDACFLDQRGTKVDDPASFKSCGSGFISACPDPDGAGLKYPVLSDTNMNGCYRERNACSIWIN